MILMAVFLDLMFIDDDLSADLNKMGRQNSLNFRKRLIDNDHLILCAQEGSLSFQLIFSNEDEQDSLYFLLPDAFDLINEETETLWQQSDFAIPLTELVSGDTLRFRILLDPNSSCGQDILSLFTASGQSAFVKVVIRRVRLVR